MDISDPKTLAELGRAALMMSKRHGKSVEFYMSCFLSGEDLLLIPYTPLKTENLTREEEKAFADFRDHAYQLLNRTQDYIEALRRARVAYLELRGHARDKDALLRRMHLNTYRHYKKLLLPSA